MAANLVFKINEEEMIMKVKLPLNQHLGLLSRPVVRVGDLVNRGELIAEENKLGVNIHATVSGKVKEVRHNEIVIKADKYQATDYEKIDSGDRLTMIKDAGIVDYEGFPAYLKYTDDKDAKLLLIDCTDRSSLFHDLKLFKKDYQKIINGINHIKRMSGIRKAHILFNKGLLKEQSWLKEKITIESGVKLRLLDDDIINYRAERRISNDQIISEQLEVVKRITEAIEEQKPYISKNITLQINTENHNLNRSFFEFPLGVYIKNFSGVKDLNNYRSLIDDYDFKTSTLITKTSHKIKIDLRKKELVKDDIIETGYIRRLNSFAEKI